MTINIWINRAGPSRIQAMRMLRGNPDRTAVKIFATRTNPSNPSLKFCDVRGSEPGSENSNEAYARFAVDYVRTHRIRIIIPTSWMTALSMVKEELAGLGCTVMVPDEDICQITDSKTRTYRHAQQMGVEVPPFYLVRNSVEFRDAVWAVQRAGFRAIVKPDTGWAAASFRIIQDQEMTLSDLMRSVRPVVDMETYATVLDKAERSGEVVPSLIVMPYLEGPECSVDMVSTSTGEPCVSVLRAKSGWYREFRTDDVITSMAHTLAQRMPLPYLTNVQVRYLEGRPVLLEVNPRPSAGTFHTEAAGVNLYWEAVKAALGRTDIAPCAQTGGRILVTDSAVPMPE